MNRIFAAISNRASRAIMPESAIPAARPLIIAGAVSLALHGGVLAAASWLWIPTAPPQAPSLIAVAVVPEALVRSPQQSKRIAATAERDAARKKALAALRTVKRRPPTAPKPTAPAAQPKKVEKPLIHKLWGKAPPVPPSPPAFRLRRVQKTPTLVQVNSPHPNSRADKPVSIKITAPIAGPGRADDAGQTAKITRSRSPSATARTRPVAGLGNPAPVYPWISRRRGEQGRVVLDVAVTADGRAKTIRVKRSSGSARLDQAALAAVKRWRFSPALRGGRAVAGRIDVPIAFQLTK